LLAVRVLKRKETVPSNRHPQVARHIPARAGAIAAATAVPSYHGVQYLQTTGSPRMEGMIDRLEGMLAKGTDNLLLRFSLGKAYAEQDCFREAETHLRAALAFDPTYSVAWKWLGKACLGLGDKAGARAAWDSGLKAAEARGDKQVEKELQVFIKRLDREAAAQG